MAAEKKEREYDYNAKGSPEEREADDSKPEFKAGGKTRRKLKKGGMAKHHVEIETKHEGEGNVVHHHHHYKNAGKVEGEKARERADRPKRAHRAAGGRTPYSSGADVTPTANDKAGRGHESERPSEDGG